MVSRDWVAWHDAYNDPRSSLSRRLAVVQRHIAAAIDRCPPGRVTLISACAGQGRDVIGALADHPRRPDVRGLLVELDPHNVDVARRGVEAAGLGGIQVRAGDASCTDAYVGYLPADVIVFCGIFGNVTDDDVRFSIQHLPGLCAPDAAVIWTRHRKEPDLTPTIRQWFAEAGFDEVDFVEIDESTAAVGVNRLHITPPAFGAGVQLFRFVGYDSL